MKLTIKQLDKKIEDIEKKVKAAQKVIMESTRVRSLPAYGELRGWSRKRMDNEG